ncbi:hypothetical protein BUALT_Bualt08G0114600 [Buddleja alternifolia]|uniref:Uncharacterized protein n=1 Tax=Buddleja alternifolia TaxID=168488 RepID=A0AAV6X9F5_9LAMI|nr:hypothetical protein BUALT_Bualt08G0114600 [Buddleja alternifolia]
MVRKEGRAFELEDVIQNSDAYHEFVRARAGSGKRLRECKRQLEQGDMINECYKNFLQCLLNKDQRLEPNAKRKQKDIVSKGNDDSSTEEESDTKYELSLRNLEKKKKSYVVEDEHNGEPLCIEYGVEGTMHCNYEPEARRKTRSGVKKDKGISNQKSYVRENSKLEKKHWQHEGKSQIQEKIGNEIKGKNSRAMICSSSGIKPDYVNDQVYDKGDLSLMVLDYAIVSKEVTSKMLVPSGENFSEYRNQVLNEMRKPYDREEYSKLKHDIEFRKPVERHMDLRNGRGRSYSFNKNGKSLLDHYPDLMRKLREFKNDRRKRLKILRGFFFWLQNVPQEGAFIPWQDPQCLAVVQED